MGELSAVSADSLFDVDHTPHYTVALGGMGQQGWLAATVELTPASGFGYTEVVVFQYSGSTLTPKLTIGSQDPSGDANFFGTVLDWSGDTLMVCSPESTAPDEAMAAPRLFSWSSVGTVSSPSRTTTRSPASLPTRWPSTG